MKKENNLNGHINGTTTDASELLDIDEHNQQNSLFSDSKLTTANLFTSRINVIATELKPPKTQSISCRQVLWYLAFVGFAVNYMIRINLNIAIVDMIRTKKISNNGNVIVSECYNQTTELNQFLNVSLLNDNGQNQQNNELTPSNGRFSFERQILNFFNIKYDENGFDWDEHQQGLLLGSFYWLHWVTQIPGGILARKYGTKFIFGMTNFVGCLFCGLMPIISFIDIRLLLILRVLQGFILGLAWPSMHHMTASWIPPNERSHFVTAYLGSSVGIAVFFPIFGYVIAWSSWEWVFHLCAIIGTCWFIAWQLLVYDSPDEHPRIESTEKAYIRDTLAGSFQTHTKVKTPWKQIFTSVPVWMNVISQFGGIWGLFTLMTQGPTYFKLILGWDMRTIGLLSGLPHLTRMIFAYYFSIFGDYLLSTNKMTRTNVRKFAGTVCNIVNGIFIIALAYSGCNSIAAVIYLTIATSVHGAVSTGPLASVVDQSPNFSGIVLGLNGMIGVLPGFISPYIVGHLTLGNQTVQQWQYVFLLAAFMLISTGILYLIFADSELQSWNDEPKKCEYTHLETQKSTDTQRTNMEDDVDENCDYA